MNYEIRLLNSIIDNNSYTEAVNGGAENVFMEYRDIWNFISKHHDEFKKTPSKDTVKHHYADFDFVATPEPTRYYLDEAKRESLAYQTRVIVSRANNVLNELGPKQSLSYLMDETSKLYKFSSSLIDPDLSGVWKDRADYL